MQTPDAGEVTSLGLFTAEGYGAWIDLMAMTGGKVITNY